MIIKPLFFKAVFNREDTSWNSYTIKQDGLYYSLFENGNFIVKYLEIEDTKQFFQDEYYTVKS